jgi:hypothetical protein
MIVYVDIFYEVIFPSFPFSILTWNIQEKQNQDDVIAKITKKNNCLEIGRNKNEREEEEEEEREKRNRDDLILYEH